MNLLTHAEDCIARCRSLALHTEEPGFTTRTFLSAPMQFVHRDLRLWMLDCGMWPRVDAAGNLRGVYGADGPALFIGSHLDTVPHAGAFDGILGVVMGVKLVELIQPRQLPYGIEVLGFSEEEGVRFGFPFIGSMAFTGEFDPSSRSDVADAIRAYGFTPGPLPQHREALGYVEFHIEQGPVLESLDASVAVVEAIAGQSRLQVAFEGRAGHAGTTPMSLRQDALAGAAEWMCAVEAYAASIAGLVATVGRIEVQPGAGNVIPSSAAMSLDVRHANNAVRLGAVRRLLKDAEEIAARRRLAATHEVKLDQPAVAMDAALTERLSAGVPHRLVSGAGHDAMVLARHMPAAMLFVRSPGGISHHPDETVLPEDVAVALECGLKFLESLA